MRTIEERLLEILDELDAGEAKDVVPRGIAYLVRQLLADFRAEGIAGRTIREQQPSPRK